MLRLAAICVALSTTLFCLSGCSTSEATVTGVVTLDGKPLETGVVTFNPATSGALAYGQIGKEGRYELKTGNTPGLKVGEYLVSVSASGPMPAPTPQNREPVPALITPQKYASKETSGFKFTVAAGKNEINLELVSK